MKKGKLIVIEGCCDGIGKTTQYNKLIEKLESLGYTVVKHHFPTYNTFQGKEVEEYLQGKYGNPSELSPYFIHSLYAYDRSITWFTKLKKEYDDNKIILLDRYTTSSLFYQSALIEDKIEKNKFIDYVVETEYSLIGIKEPDQVIFLEAPFDVITNLRNKRNKDRQEKEDIHEKNLDFMKKVYDSSKYVSKYLGWTRIECANGNVMKSIEEIHEEIMSKLNLK